MNLKEMQTFMSSIRHVQFSPGLRNEEFQLIESRFDFKFPDDLREFLSIGVPVSHGGYDWRSKVDAEIKIELEIPMDGILFDVGNNCFWLDEWGQRPTRHEAAQEMAQQEILKAPTLIPIFGHRYISVEPTTSGNPVFSVHQSDIIYYGADIYDYLQNEFGIERDVFCITGKPKEIHFWTRIVER